MNGFTRRTLVAGTASAILTTGTAGKLRAQAAKPLRIGVILPLSGPQAVFGKDVQIGAQIAADNLKGAGGGSVELVFRDDKADPNQAVAAARELSGDGINLFIAGLFTPTALAIAGILADLDAVLITCGAVADSLTHEKYNRNVFRIHDHTFLKCQGLSRLMAERYSDVTSWAGIFADIESGWNSYKSFVSGAKKFYPELAKQAPTFTTPIATKFGTSDFKNQISQLMSQPAQGLFFNVNGDEAVTFFAQARPFGLASKFKVFADIGQELLLAKALTKNTPPNFWSGSHWYYGAYTDNAVSKMLYDGYVARTGNASPAGYASVSHSGVLAFAAAAKAAGSTTTAVMIAMLEGLRFESARGTVTFRKEDHQAIGETNFIKLGPLDSDPGWIVSEFARIPSVTTVEPASPGVALKYD